MTSTRLVLLGSLVGSLAIFGTLSLGDRLAVRSAQADSTSGCTDWEVQWFEPTVPAPTVVAPQHTRPNAGVAAVPSGWEPIGGSIGYGIAGYALRRCAP